LNKSGRPRVIHDKAGRRRSEKNRTDTDLAKSVVERRNKRRQRKRR
jgi:hypothetical protein